MSTKKDKLLENAQKFISKGQVDKAIKEYEQVVALDAKDIRSRQRLAELLVRVNRRDDAIAEYETIGRYYAENAYHLKAIAVYKQIQKLDPSNIETSLCLASLNEKQGLAGNALAEYDQVFSHYQNEQMYGEALKIIDKMLGVDPENLNTRLKLAETEMLAGHGDKSYAEFIRLLQTLQKRGDNAAFKQISDRVHSLFPAQEDIQLDLAAGLIGEGRAAEVVAQMQEFLKSNGANRKAWQYLVDAFAVLGERDKCAAAYAQMLKLFPRDIELRGALFRFLFEGGDVAEAVTFLGTVQGEFAAAKALPDLEAMYIRVLEQEHANVNVLEGLKSIYQEQNDRKKLQVIEDKLKALVPDRTESAAMAAEAALPDLDEVPELIEDELQELELEEQVAPELPEAIAEVPPDVPLQEPAPSGFSGTSAAAAVEAEDSGEWEEELDLSFLDEGELAPAADEIVPSEAGVALQDGDLPMQEASVVSLELGEDGELSLPELDYEAEFGPAVDGRGEGAAEDLPAEVAQENFVVEPEGVGASSEVSYDDDDRSWLETDSYDPGRSLQHAVGTDQESSGIEPGDMELPTLGLGGIELPEFDAGDLELPGFGSEPVELPDFGGQDEESAVPGGAEEEVSLDGEFELPELPASQDELPFTVPADNQEIPEIVPGLEAGLSPDEEQQLDFSDEELDGMGAGFFPDESPRESITTPVAGPAIPSGGGIRLEEQLDDEDAETHYNLGIAYKEMGLFDEAIAELRLAGRSPAHTFACLTLEGICYRDKGDLDKAEEVYRNGIGREGLSGEERHCLLYELAFLQESSGRLEQALQLYREIQAGDPTFRDTRAKIALLEGGADEPGQFDLDLEELELEEPD